MNTNPRNPASSERARINGSVLRTQLLLASATVLLVLVSHTVFPALLGNTPYAAGVLLILVVTTLAAGVPWNRLDKRWIIVLPLLDIVGIIIAREGAPVLGVTYLLIFPVIWLATHFGLRGAVGSVLVVSILLLSTVVLRDSAMDPGEVPRLASVVAILSFLAATTYSTTNRAAAQRVLLTQQAALFEDALQRSTRHERLLDALFNAVDFGVVGFDSSGHTTFINRAQRDLFDRFGADADGTITRTIVFHEDGVTPYALDDTPYQRAIRGEKVERVTIWVGEPGTAQLAFLISARPILGANGQPDGGIMVARDVTAEIRAIRARDDLVASVSHELRTPLTSILGYLELALDDHAIDPSTRRMLQVASKNSDRLLALVADLLTAASTIDNELTVVLAPCDLSVIVAEAVESLGPIAAERSIRFEVGRLPAIALTADAFRLRQVVDNLLSNAIKYNKAAGSITVTLGTTNSSAELRVIDTGRGMTDVEQRDLFQRFYRADSVRGTSMHGTGLGLSISREITRRHGGELRLESVHGVGTTAIATLPLSGAATC